MRIFPGATARSFASARASSRRHERGGAVVERVALRDEQSERAARVAELPARMVDVAVGAVLAQPRDIVVGGLHERAMAT